MTDEKIYLELECQHSIAVNNGLSGSLTLYVGVRNSHVCSVRVSQALVIGRRSGSIVDVRNVEALQAVREWLAVQSIRDGQLIVQLQYTDGITSRSRVRVGQVQAI